MSFETKKTVENTVISPQTIRDVETFVASTPLAVKPLVEILKTSSPF
jgi:hypothetical protein